MLLYAALCLLLWPGLCGSSMVNRLDYAFAYAASMIHLWATIRGNSFPVTNSLSPTGVQVGVHKVEAQQHGQVRIHPQPHQLRVDGAARPAVRGQ
jgi:hypothetical protein